MRTQVGIIGAGPAGLLLARLLHLVGIESVIIEQRDRRYIEERVRAGVLENGTVDVLQESGVGERLKKEGIIHHGIDLRFNNRPHRIDVTKLTGRSVWVYAQHEIVKDLVAARLESKRPILFEAENVNVEGYDTDEPKITFRHNGVDEVLHCDFIAGCDGFHGVCRASIDPSRIKTYDHIYPFAWLGVLVDAPPASHEVIYAYHESGFALQSMRSPEISRLYVQCGTEDAVEDWSDDRVWSELHKRLHIDGGWHQQEGKITQKGITSMRSFVAEPMRFGRMFLAGDAAHIVPPTGAKGLNLAVGDVRVLTKALSSHYHRGSDALLDAYSETCLRRVWRMQRFASGLANTLHRFPQHGDFQHRMQLAELDYMTSSDAAARLLAENYTGLPLEAFS